MLFFCIFSSHCYFFTDDSSGDNIRPVDETDQTSENSMEKHAPLSAEGHPLTKNNLDSTLEDKSNTIPNIENKNATTSNPSLCNGIENREGNDTEYIENGMTEEAQKQQITDIRVSNGNT